MVQWLWKTVWQLLKKLNKEPWSSNSATRYLIKRNENVYSQKNLYTNGHSSIIHNNHKVEATLNFMAAVAICSDFEAQENKVCHCFHCFPIYLPWSDGTRCSHEIKRHLLLGRKAMTNLDSILKSRHVILLTNVYVVNAMVFPIVMYGWESWTIKKSGEKKKKAEHRRIDDFELWCWRRLLRVLWTARRSNQSVLKEISPKYSLEGLMLKLKLQYFGHLMRRTTGRDPQAGKDWRQEEKGMTEDEMVGWHHQLDGHEFEQALGVGDGQGSLACCSPWDCKE